MTNNAYRTDRVRGFSLIEVLLAIALLGILVSFYAGSIVQSLRMREHIAGTVRQFETMQGLMTRLENDVRGLYLEVRRPAAVDAGTGATSEDVSHTLVVLEDNSEGSAALDKFNFTSSANYVFFLEGGDHNEFSHVEIGYEFVEDEEADDGTYRMLRRSDVTMDDEPTEGGALYDIARGIRGFDVHLYDPDPAEMSWKDSWDTRDNANKLPAAIQIFVWYGGDRDDRDTWKLLAKTIILDVQSGGEMKQTIGGSAGSTGGASGATGGAGTPAAKDNPPTSDPLLPPCSDFPQGRERMSARLSHKCQ